MESAQNESQPKDFVVRSAWISFLVSGAVLSLKFAAFWITSSRAVFSDAAESIINVVAALMALIIMKKVSEPADEDHPYGHGKLEYFSAAFEGGLIAFAALAIGFGAVEALLRGQTLHQLEMGLIIVGAAGLINIFLGLYLLKIGKAHKSEAMLASGSHVLTDVWSTVGVFLGLLLVKWTGWLWIDPVVALMMAVLLLKAGYKIVRRSVSALVDEIEPGALNDLSKCFMSHRQPGIIDIHQVKVIRSGRFHHVDAHLVVPEFWNISQAHEVMENFEKAVVKSYPYDGEIAFHLDPCDRKYCQMCDLETCTVRQEKFQQLKDYSLDTLIQSGLSRDLSKGQ